VVDERQLLYLESNIPIFGETRFALNDCTFLKRDTSSMITIHTYINGAYLNSYWADGLIIATPTGSTGYSLSCGGPIIFPNSGNFVITPVAPHNLHVRPIVISDDSIVSFEVEGRAENFLCTLDSRFETITAEHQLAVRRNDFSAKIIRLHEASFLYTLRNKLRWGLDTRND
ncbi:MAG: NAD(+) kinase, partial [Bacteroidota bacterium]